MCFCSSDWMLYFQKLYDVSSRIIYLLYHSIILFGYLYFETIKLMLMHLRCHVLMIGYKLQSILSHCTDAKLKNWYQLTIEKQAVVTQNHKYKLLKIWIGVFVNDVTLIWTIFDSPSILFYNRGPSTIVTLSVTSSPLDLDVIHGRPRCFLLKTLA